MKAQVLELRRKVADEAGAALIVVLALSITMLIMITAALSFSLSGVKVANTDADTTAALAAAYAGVDEYASRLSNDSLYQRYGNPLAPFTVATGSSGTVSLPPTGQENPAFGLGTAPGITWATIAGTTAMFRYEVDNSRYSGTGTVRVRSTGRVGNQTQSVVADLKQTGFIDYLYFSNYEIMDPDIKDTRCTEAGGWSAFVSGGVVQHAPYCQEIQFGSSDVLNGKLHSNDMLRICGATFNKQVTSSSKITSPEYVKSCGTAGIFSDKDNVGGVIPRTPEMQMPPTNTGMKYEARVDLDAQVPRPGCMYTGPTTMTFLSNGKVTVVSPWTKFTRPSLTAGIPSRNDAECGDLAALHTSAGATFVPPAQNLLYVQGVVADDPTDPNYWAPPTWVAPVWVPKVGKVAGHWTTGYWTTGEVPPGYTCNNATKDNEGWVFKQPSSGPTIQFPLPGERTPEESSASAPSYGCLNGDAYIKGTVSGQITVASGNSIYVTGDLLYNDSALDVMGIVANNAVWVWNPMDASKNPMTAPSRTIDGAILSVNHTFQVQNYAIGGSRGTLTVFGAIAQKFRGTVGQGSNGYAKSYNYDSRLFSISPPKFLLPTSTTYGVTKYALVKTAFAADGSTIP